MNNERKWTQSQIGYKSYNYSFPSPTQYPKQMQNKLAYPKGKAQMEGIEFLIVHIGVTYPTSKSRGFAEIHECVESNNPAVRRRPPQCRWLCPKGEQAQRGRIPIILVLFSNGRSQNADGFVLRGNSVREEGFLAVPMGATYPRKKNNDRQ